MKQKFSVTARFKSMSYAFNGFKVLLEDEHNARVHLVATVLVYVLALVLDAATIDWIIITIVVALVWVTEALNTSIETLCDLVSTDYDPRIKKIKDVAAAAVFMASFFAFVCGLLVFIPLIF